MAKVKKETDTEEGPIYVSYFEELLEKFKKNGGSARVFTEEEMEYLRRNFNSGVRYDIEKRDFERALAISERQF